jgi:hypothetical protein
MREAAGFLNETSRRERPARLSLRSKTPRLIEFRSALFSFERIVAPGARLHSGAARKYPLGPGEETPWW